MKTLFYVLLIILLASCTTVKLASVSSNSVPVKNNHFVFENDTVRITYDFWGDNGIMHFDIYNKLNDPIYCDWKNSAFIPNDQMVSYWQDVTNTTGYVVASSWVYGTGSAAAKSKSVHQERIAVIPPHSLITQKSFKLVKDYKSISKVGDYTIDNTSLNFRNYLMFGTNENFTGIVSKLDNQFYVSKIVNVKWSKKENYKSPESFIINPNAKH